MPQQELLPAEAMPSAEDIHPLAVIAAAEREHNASKPADLRHAMMMMTVADQNVLLATYEERRLNFRRWLESKLIEGVHRGYPPGCMPRWEKRADGLMWYEQKGRGGSSWYPETQWQPKPELYVAGADFICDLTGVRDTYHTDIIGWQMMGSRSGTAVIKCVLLSRANGENVGEGLGAYHDERDPNKAIKLAAKCAKVAAVIHTYGLRDLFTQDLRPAPDTNDNAEADPDKPAEQPRAERKKGGPPTTQTIGYVLDNWKHSALGRNGAEPLSDEAKATDRQRCIDWARRTVGRMTFNPFTRSHWTEADVEKCCQALGIELPE